MATKQQVQTTYEAARTIEPIYTGGDISANATGSIIATIVEEDVLIVNTTSSRSICRIEGDGEAVTSLCLAPNGAYLAICSRSLSMRIFSLDVNEEATVATAILSRTLKPHNTPVVSSAIDSASVLLATGGADGTVKIWDLRGGYATHNLHAHGGVVSALHFFQARVPEKKNKKVVANGSAGPATVLATASEEGDLKIWNLATSKSFVSLEAHASVIRSLDSSTKNNLLLSASRDKTIILWDTQTWSQRRIIPTFEVLEAAGIVLEGRYCYGAGENGQLRIWDLISGSEVTKRKEAGLETEAIVAAVALTAELLIMTIHQDQTLKFHSMSSLAQTDKVETLKSLPIVRRKTANLDEVIDMACVGPERTVMALAINTESVKMLSIQGDDVHNAFGSDVGSLEGHKDIIICLDVDWSGHWLVTGAKDNTARLWRLDPARSSYECAAIFEGHAESIGAVSLPKSAPVGKAANDPLNYFPAFMITGSTDKTIKRWDLSKLKPSLIGSEVQAGARAIFTRVAHEKDINAIDSSPSAPLFASASQDRTIKVWSLEDGSVTGILRGHKRGVWSVKFSPAGAAAISLSEGGSSSSRGLLLSGSGDKTVKVWSLSTYTCLLTLEGHSNSVLKVIWLPQTPYSNEDNDEAAHSRHARPKNQPYIASASADTLIKLWDPYAASDSDHLLTTLDNHSDRVWALASPIATSSTSSTSFASTPPFPLISGAADATLTFWRDTTTQTTTIATQRATERIEQDQLLQNHIHAKNYREVITLSLALNHPGRLLRVFQDVIALPTTQQEQGTIMGVSAVDDVLSSLDAHQVYQLLERVRDWNTNARTSPVAQRVLGVVLRSYDADFFLEMARDRRLKGVRELLRALEVYTDRHYKRLEELVDESYLLEYTLREMGEVAGTNGVNGHGVGGANGGDMVMT
ncbi:putative U3 small nucleolar RNA-associated protein 13 [Cyphellophora attinorum]|uniref:Putative U3 small nucleolar RNA-associated protein 13 n=1 Tax=Cyphellophora attinorum TaxID=1664694 RepID=A0A0N1P2L0_9EURO|nr:putative U3 small nucleolar RNA-associated protein 13 [Phialophora attinorum]KPI45736.1 putative U3 small nucleolar RNA-associated protein 13 [Phialophora attinorum]